MRIFISAGEPSGDLHGANLIAELRRRRPEVEVVGFGGDQMERAGCRLLFPIVELAVMWFARVLVNLPKFLDLVSRADRSFRHQRPDAVVLIDFPGFNWWIARRARFHGIPVFYYVPPQIWAWASWRIKKMRRFVDHVLCSLPFEESWYRDRGVPAIYIGHPYFDELAHQELDSRFLAEQAAGDGRLTVGLLPGSRTQEVSQNVPTMIEAARAVQTMVPRARFLVACYRDHHAGQVRRRLAGTGLDARIVVRRTAEVIHLADACVAVSGSVGLELLYRATPTVVLYRISPIALRFARPWIHAPFIGLANLLAGQEVMPEFLTCAPPAEAARPIARQVSEWLLDRAARDRAVGALEALRTRVARPGATTRAAQYIIHALSTPRGPGPRLRGPHARRAAPVTDLPQRRDPG